MRFYCSKKTVSLTIATVHKSLILRFVPCNIRLEASTGEQYIERYVADVANRLCLSNPYPNNLITIACIDTVTSEPYDSHTQ